MSKLKKVLLMCTAYVLAAALAIGGTVAYLISTDDDVNVMTLGNVKIEQHEYERVQNADGTYEMVTSAKYGEGYKLQPFTQNKPLYPVTGEVTGWGKAVYFDQIGEGASGGQKVLDGINNIQDKFVLVENTGKTDAYVRTLIAYEIGSLAHEQWNTLVMTSGFDNYTVKDIGIIEVKGNNYFVIEYVYAGNSTRHAGGILPAGEYTYNSLAQIYLKSTATNEDCEALDGNGNGTYDILVFSQAVQTAGFADAKTALDTAFGETTTTNHPWTDGVVIPQYVNYDVNTTGTSYGNFTDDGEISIFENANITTQGGGISVWGTAEFNSGSIVNNSTSTSGRHVFYVAAGNDDESLLTINGGEFTFSPNNLQRKGYYICAHGEGAVVIVNGGTFNKPSQRSGGMISADPYKGGICEYEGGQVIIRGGSFAFDPTEWVDEGYEAVKDDITGFWTVSTKN